MKFFDYIFYRICKAYKGTSDKSPDTAASAIISIIQIMNICSILMLIELNIQEKTLLNKADGIVIILFILIFNHIRYLYRDNNSYNTLQLRWLNDRQEFKKGVLVLMYILLSIIISLGLAIILGSKKW